MSTPHTIGRMSAPQLQSWLEDHALNTAEAGKLTDVSGEQLVSVARRGETALQSSFQVSAVYAQSLLEALHLGDSIHGEDATRHAYSEGDCQDTREFQLKQEVLQQFDIVDVQLPARWRRWLFSTSTRHKPVTLRTSLKDTVKKNIVHIVKATTTPNPYVFALTALGLCKGGYDRVQIMKKNKAAAEGLAKRIKQVVKFGGPILVYFEKIEDGERLIDDEAEELLEASFCAFRLIGDYNKDSKAKAILHFLGCHQFKKAIHEAKQRLLEAVSFTAMGAISTMVKEQRTPGWLSTLSSVEAEDAVQFWIKHNFQESVSVRKLVDAIVLWVHDADMGDSHGNDDGWPNSAKAVRDEQAVFSFFSRQDTIETTTIQRFALFVKDSPSIAHAATAVVERMEDAKLRKALRNVLAPVDFGRDLIKHQRAFVEGTRQWVFDAFEEWAMCEDDRVAKKAKQTRPHSDKDKGQRRVFWVKGTGGLGKSVIAAQLIKRYGQASTSKQPLIAAHYFCKHDATNRNDPRKAINTLAFRLATQLPELREEYKAILQGENEERRNNFTTHADGSEGTVEDAFNVVLAEPLKAALGEDSGGKGSDVFILIDALDELRAGNSRAQFLRLVGKLLPSLPPCVRIVVTSRPEEDILALLKNLNPFTIDKQDERQREDLQLCVRNIIIKQSSLGKLNQDEQEEVVQMVVDRADGVFLAVRLIACEVDKAEGNTRHPLTVADIRRLVGKGGSFIDGTYTETLDRIQARIKEAAGDDDGVLAALQGTLHDMLAVIVASLQPLRVDDLHELCGGGRVQSKALTKRLLSALSLLFSSSSKHDVVEPLHKTVNDFLTDKQRAGPHFVDEREGHAILARACLRVLEDRGLLSHGDKAASSAELVEEKGAEESVVVYAIAFGHQHLTTCAEAMQAQATFEIEGLQRACEAALCSWQGAWLQPRGKAELTKQELALVKDGALQQSQHEATKAFAQWLLLQTYTLGRTKPLVAELAALVAATDEIKDREALHAMLDDVRRMYGTHWASEEDIRTGIAQSCANLPLRSSLAASPAIALLWTVSSQPQPLMTIPPILTQDPCLMQLKGHTGYVTSVSFSADGKRLVSGSWDKTVRVWDASTGQELARCIGHTDWVTSVVFTPDNKHIMSVSDDKTVRTWDSDTTDELILRRMQTEELGQRAAVSANGKYVRTGIWAERFRAGNHNTPNSSATSASVSPDGQRIVSGCADNTVRVWDAHTGHKLAQWNGHTASISSVAFSDDGKLIASGSQDMTVRIWDAGTGNLLAQCDGHLGDVNSVTFSADGTRIASGSDDKTVRIWNAKTGQEMATYIGHADNVTSVTFSPDGKRIVSGSIDSTVRIWDAGVRQTLAQCHGHTNDVYSVAFSPDDKRIVSGSHDKTVRVWDAETGQELAQCNGHTNSVTSVSFSPTGTRIVSGSKDKTVRIWNTDTGEELARYSGHTGKVRSVALSRDGKLIVSGSGTPSALFTRGEDYSVRIWDVTTGQQLTKCDGHTDVVTSVAFGPDGQHIVSGSRDNTVCIWDVTTGQQLTKCDGHTDVVTSVAFGPDGRRIVSGSRDNTVCIWDVTTGQQLTKCDGHTDVVTSVAFGPDGRRIVSGSHDKTVRVWDSSTGEDLCVYRGHTSTVRSAVFSTLGTFIVSGGYDNTVRIWNTERMP
ncbi:WD-40 repeat protein [Salpingoeca rosetta]|uniref:WD-40 repeat protein n=1 Tax=Salpingoeca rosetta (strain ATCC 50818 / BSB-021) TaxID=946362 RepID=F2USK2_SALR5|nr:WD-40 repeat protein [Salpingoeca rosetta]EGD81111.1 WD-40 repeat protein [Salpingoeca rosetta]|eukprot:XP_004987796.1 WD-40 repeat protein [Salpingoeca rosetta]